MKSESTKELGFSLPGFRSRVVVGRVGCGVGSQFAQRARPDEVAIGSDLCVGMATEEEKAAVYPVHIVSGRIGSRPGMCGGCCG